MKTKSASLTKYHIMLPVVALAAALHRQGYLSLSQVGDELLKIEKGALGGKGASAAKDARQLFEELAKLVPFATP